MDSQVWSSLLILFKPARRLRNSDTRQTEAEELQVRAYRARAGLKTPKQTVTADSYCPAQPLRNSSWSTGSRTLGIPLPGMPRACERRGQVRARPHVTPGRARRESASLRLLARLPFPGCAVLNRPAPSRGTETRGTGSALAPELPLAARVRNFRVLSRRPFPACPASALRLSSPLALR